MAHQCSAIVVTCIDFRLQRVIEKWCNKNLGEKEYDRVAWAGGVFDLTGILKQIEISNRLHEIKKVVLVNHEDCGAYGEAGTPERHDSDLKNAAAKVIELYPHLEVETYYLHLDGVFEKV